MNDLVFISMPYSDKNPETVEYRIEKSRQLSLRLLTQNTSSVSPAQIGHDLLKSPSAKDMDTTFNYWGDFSFDLLAKSSMVIFLVLDGFVASKGVQAEYTTTIQSGKPFLFLDADFKLTNNPFLNESH